MSSEFSVAIVGGGFSGTVLAARLLSESPTPVRVVVFDREGAFEAGLAYSTDDPHHFLNVPAEMMSAFDERPSHFIDWLVESGLETRGEHIHTFTRRRNYRTYLQSQLKQAGTSPLHEASRLEKITEEVVGIGPDLSVEYASGHAEKYDAVVLATGYRRDSGLNLESSLASPFQPEKWPSAGVQHAVIVGSSLTAMDAAATLFRRYPAVNITCISRHGRWPQAHLYEPLRSGIQIPEGALNIRMLVRLIRSEIHLAETQGGSWRSVFDVLRPQWESIWQRLPDREQTRFVRHLMRIFDAYRHRIPPPLDDFLQPYRDSGALRVKRGRVAAILADAVKISSAAGSEELRGDIVVDCTGFSADLRASQDPLYRSLFREGLVRSGSMGLGLSVDADGQVEGMAGVYALGPVRRGNNWETTAVPEVRKQIATVCASVLTKM